MAALCSGAYDFIADDRVLQARSRRFAPYHGTTTDRFSVDKIPAQAKAAEATGMGCSRAARKLRNRVSETSRLLMGWRTESYSARCDLTSPTELRARIKRWRPLLAAGKRIDAEDWEWTGLMAT